MLFDFNSFKILVNKDLFWLINSVFLRNILIIWMKFSESPILLELSTMKPNKLFINDIKFVFFEILRIKFDKSTFDIPKFD